MFSLTLYLFFTSCSDETNANLEDSSLDFTKVEKILGMKEQITPKGRELILAKYGTLENFIEVWSVRKELIGNRAVVGKSTNTRRVTLFNENEGLNETYQNPVAEYIRDSAEWHGIDLPNCDRAGASPGCAAMLTRGYVDQSEQSFLEDEDLESGFILLCVSYPVSDCTIRTHMEEYLGH